MLYSAVYVMSIRELDKSIIQLVKQWIDHQSINHSFLLKLYKYKCLLISIYSLNYSLRMPIYDYFLIPNYSIYLHEVYLFKTCYGGGRNIGKRNSREDLSLKLLHPHRVELHSILWWGLPIKYLQQVTTSCTWWYILADFSFSEFEVWFSNSAGIDGRRKSQRVACYCFVCLFYFSPSSSPRHTNLSVCALQESQGHS